MHTRMKDCVKVRNAMWNRMVEKRVYGKGKKDSVFRLVIPMSFNFKFPAAS